MNTKDETTVISRLISGLRNAGLDPTSREVADILWMFGILRDDESESIPAEDLGNDRKPEETVGKTTPDVIQRLKREGMEIFLPGDETPVAGVPGMAAVPIRLPSAEALPGKLDICRSLRPLMRKAKSRIRFQIDPEPTIRRIMETGNWLPVMRPRPARWLDVAVVADAGPSMSVWQDTVSEFKTLLERLGAFKRVGLWWADTEGKKIGLRRSYVPDPPDSSAINPTMLIDPTGRRLILVLSDCVNAAWHDGRMARMFAVWEKRAMTAVVQMLPQRLWHRTGLGAAEPVRLSGKGPGTPNKRLAVRHIPTGFEPGEEDRDVFVSMPTVTTEPEVLNMLAKSVAGFGRIQVPGVLMDTKPDTENYPYAPITEKPFQRRMEAFVVSASPLARRLAAYLMATSPLSLPTMHLVRKTMLPGARTIHLAEILLSGLLRETTRPEYRAKPETVRYQFEDGVMDKFLGFVLTGELIRVIEFLSKYINDNMGAFGDFNAVLQDISGKGTARVAPGSSPVAILRNALLRRLGGVFAEIADRSETVRLDNLNMTFVYIPPGKFMMGSPKNEPERRDDEKQHEVTLTKGFYMQTTPVTQGQYAAVMGTNPSRFKDGGPDCPVENVSWEDAQAFIKKLNEMSEHRFRLPTEAEWEYACRAGTKTPFWTGKCLGTDQANYDGNYPMKGCSKGEYRIKTTPVTRFEPNPWGLHDMHGNVWEWCEDWYGEYPEGAAIDPPGPSTGSDRVLRGGSWVNYARFCRSANRFWDGPGLRNFRLGFRLVCLPGQ